MLKVVSCSAIDKFDLSIGDIKDHKDFELCGILIVDHENELSFRVDVYKCERHDCGMLLITNLLIVSFHRLM